MAYSAGIVAAGRPVAMFDFDSTLRPYRGRGPSESLTLSFLAHLAETFNIVVISNRSTGKADALAPLKAYLAELDRRTGEASATAYAPGARDRDRKPHTGTWEHYVATAPLGAPPFVFYCGDAAGRPGDHSGSDYMFARNIGVAFTTPEQLFEGGRDPWVAPESVGCDASPPVALLAAPPGIGANGWLEALGPQTGGRVVILVGSPASGKSRIASYLAREHGYVVASADLQGARHRHVYVDAVATGRPVVVDNTNPTANDRRVYAEGAGTGRVRVHICHVTTPKEVCFHLNAARCQLDTTGATPELPPVAIHAYWKRLEEPTEKEAAALGARLVRVPFALEASAPAEVRVFAYPLK